MRNTRILSLAFCLMLLAGCTLGPIKPAGSTPESLIAAANHRLARTINLGDSLEAPREGDWGVTLQAEYFSIISKAGFSAVRIPIRFSSHAATSPPYMIDAGFLSRLDWAVRNANSNGLVAILDMQHYLELCADPNANRQRFLALWRQIAEHFQDAPNDMVYFEPLNEPNGKLDAFSWNVLLAETIPVIRQTNPSRPVIIDTADWGGLKSLWALRLPADPNLILTVHYYLPVKFTHQGAEWVDGSNAWLGTTWEGTPDQLAAITRDFNTLSTWAAAHQVPVFMGEFGAYWKADQTSRVRWTTAVRKAAEQHGFSWGYWEFCSVFGAYNLATGIWRPDLLNALIPSR